MRQLVFVQFQTLLKQSPGTVISIWCTPSNFTIRPKSVSSTVFTPLVNTRALAELMSQGVFILRSFTQSVDRTNMSTSQRFSTIISLNAQNLIYDIKQYFTVISLFVMSNQKKTCKRSLVKTTIASLPSSFSGSHQYSSILADGDVGSGQVDSHRANI